jgi:hypothetical protein
MVARGRSRWQDVQVRRPIQGDNAVLEKRTHPGTSLGWGGMQSDPGFKADPVAFQEVQRVHAGSLDTPVVIEDLCAIVQTDINKADETLRSVRTIVEAELANNGPQGHALASELMDDTSHSV